MHSTTPLLNVCCGSLSYLLLNFVGYAMVFTAFMVHAQHNMFVKCLWWVVVLAVVGLCGFLFAFTAVGVLLLCGHRIHVNAPTRYLVVVLVVVVVVVVGNVALQ